MSTPTSPWVSNYKVFLDEDDTDLLERIAHREKLPKSELFRRALRAYARSIGITETEPRSERSAQRVA